MSSPPDNPSADKDVNQSVDGVNVINDEPQQAPVVEVTEASYSIPSSDSQ